MPHSGQRQITLQHSPSVLVYEVMHRHTGKYKAACQYRLSVVGDEDEDEEVVQVNKKRNQPLRSLKKVKKKKKKKM